MDAIYVLESSPARSFVKGLIWEISGLVTVAATALLFTGDVSRSLTIGLVYFPVRVGCYFIHERLWKHVLWGHIKHCVIQELKGKEG